MAAPRVRFGPFAFDAATGELWRDGRRVRLQRQPSRLLELLAARSGEVVSREEIRLALWGDNTHVDFERSLNFCVAKLRSALRDNAVAPRFVETVPTRGYRLIVPVVADSPAAQALEAGVADAAPAEAPAIMPLGQPPRRWWLRAAAVAAVVAALGGLALWQQRHQPVLPKIVVVPFHNETGTADLDRLGKGVSDAAVARLATPDRLKHFLVIGNAPNLQFSFGRANMKAMGESLGAQYLLLGQLKKDDRRMRIVAHLIRVSDQTHLWAKTYDTDTLDLAQQSSIAEEIAKSVAGTVPKGE
jgi:DNA-binding winged helix-turn-helix (wHTH) protein/TolB-like protein